MTAAAVPDCGLRGAAKPTPVVACVKDTTLKDPVRGLLVGLAFKNYRYRSYHKGDVAVEFQFVIFVPHVVGYKI